MLKMRKSDKNAFKKHFDLLLSAQAPKSWSKKPTELLNLKFGSVTISQLSEPEYPRILSIHFIGDHRWCLNG